MTKSVVTTVLPTKEHSKNSSVRQKELRRALGCLVIMEWQKDSFNRGTDNVIADLYLPFSSCDLH